MPLPEAGSGGFAVSPSPPRLASVPGRNTPALPTSSPAGCRCHQLPPPSHRHPTSPRIRHPSISNSAAVPAGAPPSGAPARLSLPIPVGGCAEPGSSCQQVGSGDSHSSSRGSATDRSRCTGARALLHPSTLGPPLAGPPRRARLWHTTARPGDGTRWRAWRCGARRRVRRSYPSRGECRGPGRWTRAPSGRLIRTIFGRGP
eukprot:scaffold1273_cov401-Prasinococcus_capsulatus_cf.AAC.11